MLVKVESKAVRVIIDSGATGNFISLKTVAINRLATQQKSVLYRLTLVDVTAPARTSPGLVPVCNARAGTRPHVTPGSLYVPVESSFLSSFLPYFWILVSRSTNTT